MKTWMANMETMINAQMIYSGLWDYGKEMK